MEDGKMGQKVEKKRVNEMMDVRCLEKSAQHIVSNQTYKVWNLMNKMNRQAKQWQTHREQAGRCGGGTEGLSRQENKTHGHGYLCGNYGGWEEMVCGGEEEEGIGG